MGIREERNMRGIRAAVLLIVLFAVLLSAAAAEGGAGSVVFRSAGNIVTLGRWEQDGNVGNGPEPIEWIILEMQEGRCLLLSRYGLDAMPYNTASADVTWEQCSLRSWLNGEFLDSAFSGEERAAILLTDVDNSASKGFAGYLTDGGPMTADWVFLLSWSEADLYFSGNLAKLCAPTAWAVSRGAWTSSSYTADGKPACSWWLRSPGLDQSDAMRAGNIAYRRDDVSATRNCVRPALWLSLNADII